MTPEQFAYWLQGFAENNGARPTEVQWRSIKDHLATVFVKETPPNGSLERLLDRVRPDPIARTRRLRDRGNVDVLIC